MSHDAPPEEGGRPEPDLRPRRHEPAFNLPTALTGLLGVLVAIHLVRAYLLTPDQDGYVLFEFAFTPARYAFPLAEQSLAWLWTPVTYSFLHGGFEHLIFNAFWMAAFGAPVVRRIGPGRFAAFWCLSSAAAVGFHTLFHWADFGIVVGASGAVAGLMGAAARFVFAPHGGVDRRLAHLNRRLSLSECLANRSVLVFSGLWFATNIFIGLGLFSVAGTAPVAWEAHIGGFLFGFLLFALFDPRR
ncbi:rhomboid family intramembrane serine protease [Ensifer soli]|uniref:rhomboid family intramembrane serine protease n=1 Tax=Ciceribacter sp. sgz301302 TaxID=3342379 RepID=UPI0035B8E2E7